MAKKTTKEQTPSLSAFNEDNLLSNLEDEEVIEQEDEIEEEEEEEEIPEPKKKPVKKDQKKAKAKVEEPEEEEEPEPEEEEEETEEESEEEETEEPTPDEPDPAAFWQRVDQLTGNPVEVEYGDIDPISPEGVALREKALADKSVRDFVEKLQENYPSVYEALEYAHAGGKVEDLFKAERDYSAVVIKDDDADHAKLVLEEYYQRRGITNLARIKRMIAADEESEEGVVKTAQLALEEMKAEDAEQRAEEIETQKRIALREKEKDQRFVKSLNETILTGQIGSFKIASSREAKEFADFVRSGIQRDGKGGYMFVTPIDPANMEKQLQTEFFRFKKGDLSALITTKAQTIKAQQLRLNADREKQKKKTSVGGRQSGSLRDLDV